MNLSPSSDEKIIAYTKELRLPAIRKCFRETIEQANQENLSFEQFLIRLLEDEYQLRQESCRQNRLRQAGFPYKKYLEDLDLECLTEDARKKLKILRTLDFIKTAQNAILAGNPGTGKTHISIGLGILACMQNYRVLFTTVPRLITQLKESHSERTLRSFQNKFEKYDLVICDEFGYISFDKEGAELLFTHLSLRAGRKSTILTTNLSFDRWQELFGDPVLTAAMVDRMTHKAYLVNMSGNSYRLKETQEWIASTET